MKSSLWKHNCPFSPQSTSINNSKVNKRGDYLLPSETPAALTYILQGLRADDIGKVTVKDHLILELGRHLLKKHGNDKELFAYIRGKMRQLGSLLMALRDISGRKADTLSQFIHSTKFQFVLDAAQQCVGFNEGEQSYRNPSNAIRSCQMLKKAAEVKMAMALERGDTSTADECSQFLKLCKMRYAEVSTTARKNISERTRNGVKFLPLTEDVEKLTTYLTKEGSEQYCKL